MPKEKFISEEFHGIFFSKLATRVSYFVATGIFVFIFDMSVSLVMSEIALLVEIDFHSNKLDLSAEQCFRLLKMLPIVFGRQEIFDLNIFNIPLHARLEIFVSVVQSTTDN